MLNRYFLEHGFKISSELVKEKIKELTVYTLTVYNNQVEDSQFDEPPRKKVYKPFNELEGEIPIPREGYGAVIEHEDGRYARYQLKKQVGDLGNISISVMLERRVLDHEQQLFVYLVPDLPKSFQSIDVSLFQPFKRYSMIN